MMSLPPKVDITGYLDIAKRRKWCVIVMIAISLIPAVAYLKFSPKIYQATTLILLEPQSIPDVFVRSTVSESVEGRLRTIVQQIHSRTSLERLIREFGLDQGQRESAGAKLKNIVSYGLKSLARRDLIKESDATDKQIMLSQLVNEVRKNLTVKFRSGLPATSTREASLAFDITFEWPNIDVVAPVTNVVAARFIEDNMNIREEIAIATTDFLDKETEMIRIQLEAREKELEGFKTKHMGMLPDQLQANINILNQLREELTNLERQLEHERQQSILVRSQAQTARIDEGALTLAVRQEQRRSGGRTSDARVTTMDELTGGSLEDVERELNRLRSVYTERHPDVIVLKRRVEEMKSRGARSAGPQGQPSTSSEVASSRVEAQVAAINADAESYKKQIKEVEKEIQLYKDRVERTPQVEMELSTILRDYQTVRQRYDDLLRKKLDAKLAEQMEKRKKGEQFRVLDPAVRPPRPFKPDAIKILAMALVAGCALGVGLAFLRETMDPRFYSPEEVESVLNASVIVSLPLANREGKAA